jgi:hypothetical protein
MTDIVVSTEVETWPTKPPSQEYLDGEPYAARGATDGRVTNVMAWVETNVRHYYGDSHCKDLPGAQPGTTIYAVVADYSTGSTFGRDGGQSNVLDFFLDPDKAEALRQTAAGTRDYSFEFEDTVYSASWMGYFEDLNDISVWEVVIQPGPNDPLVPNTTHWNFKRGH